MKAFKVAKTRLYNLLNATAGIAGLTALCVFLLPAPVHSIPTVSTQYEQSLSENTHNQANVSPTLFDLHDLPIAKSSEPATVLIDPAAAIKEYRLLGVTIDDDKAIALLTSGSGQRIVKPGDTLEGFTLATISARDVSFQKDGISVTLTLPPDTRGR